MRNTWLFQLAKTFFVVMVVFAFAASAMAASKIGKTREEIIKLSKKEPPVRIATTWAGKIINFQKRGFKKKYGLSLDFTNVSGLASRERIMNEALSGIYENDLVNVSGSLRDKFIKVGIIVPINYASLFPEVRKDIISPKGHFLGTGMNQFGIAYNPKIVSPGDAPKGWQDCLNPKWKGKLAVLTRPLTWIQLHFYWKKEKSVAYHKALKNNKPVWMSSTNSTTAQVAAGEFPLLCGVQYHAVKNVLRRDPKAPIKFTVPKIFPYQVGEALAVMKGGKAPNSAILLASYLATDGAPGYGLYGRSNPNIKGTDAYNYIRKAGAKPVWFGWEAAGSVQANASREIVSTWGFPKGRKRKK